MVTRDNQKTVVCLWRWIPTEEDYDATTAANFARSFEAIKNDVDGIAGWNFGGLYQGPQGDEIRRLNTWREDEVPAL